MKPIIEPIPVAKLEAELTADKFIRKTNFGSNDVYIITAHNSPNLMQEIGRLREMAFRDAGGGTGKIADIDSNDTADVPYKQLIVWNPDERMILGGYRFILCKNLPKDDNGNIISATSKLFHFSDTFKKDYLPHLIELGRSFVHPEYQSSKSRRKGIFALDNLWDGLGALTVDNPEIMYFFGKVTMYTSYNEKARDILLYFLKLYFPDPDNLVYPINPLPLVTDERELKSIFTGKSYQDDYKILSTKCRELGENIPPLINSYMNLSRTLRTFGTTVNPGFGNVEETGILLTIADVYPSKSRRHIESYIDGKKKRK